MSITAQIRDVLRNCGGYLTARAIREQVEDDELTALQIGGALKAMEISGEVIVDRDSNPFAYLLTQKQVAAPTENVGNSERMRNALAKVDGPRTAAEIRDLVAEHAMTGTVVNSTLKALEISRDIEVNRDVRPFTYRLVAKTPKAVPAARPTAASSKSTPPAPPSPREADPSAATPPAAAPPREIAPLDTEWSQRLKVPSEPTISVPRSQIVNLAALALRTSVPLSGNELREISALITAAAAAA